MKIKASSFFSRQSLEIRDDGIKYFETAGIGGTRRFARYDEIVAVLKSAQSVLSVQIGRDTYRIPIRQANADHRAAVARLISNCKRTQSRAERVAGIES